MEYQSTLVDAISISFKHFHHGRNVLKKKFSPIYKIEQVDSLHTGASLPTCAYLHLEKVGKNLC